VILRIMNRGMSRESYEILRAELDIDRKHPLGLIMHGASEEDGVIQVAQVWDSEEYARRFDEDILRPALEAHGLPLEAEIRVFELQHLVPPEVLRTAPGETGGWTSVSPGTTKLTHGHSCRGMFAGPTPR
jgi:hypothetical protein